MVCADSFSPMTPSKTVSKRARPALGTVVHVEIAEASPALLNGLFDELERLEKIFSFHDPESFLSRYNLDRSLPLGEEFAELMQLSQRIQELSEDHFFPYQGQKLDFGGLAKGFIVDKLRQWVLARHSEPVGLINAGGDIGFLSEDFADIHLRLGSSEAAYIKKFTPSKNSVASSSIGAFCDSAESKTTYNKKQRSEWGLHATVVTQAPSAAVADAMTKIALFAPNELIAKCADHFHATAMVFNGQGLLMEAFGTP